MAQRVARSPFRLFGWLGFVAASVLCLGLTLHQRGSLWGLVGIGAASAASFFVLALATKVISGTERLVYWRHHLAAVAATVLVVGMARLPLLPSLDLVTIGLGTFLAFGRVGCTLVGCCHGKPSRVGLRYDAALAEAGFPRYYVGIQLFPVQLVEALAALLLTGAATVASWTGARPGTATVIYLSGYALVRWGLELARGDSARPYGKGFSEAQWTSLAMATAVAALAWCHWLPGGRMLASVPLALVAAMAVTARLRAAALARGELILFPVDVRELAEAVVLLAATHEPGTVPVAQTSRGLRLSASTPDGDRVHHYAISCARGSLARPAAARVAREIMRLRHPFCRSSELLGGAHGVHHLVVRHGAPGSVA
jgi:hypothetical protein